MGPGDRGTFLISWSQTRVEGKDNPNRNDCIVGAQWRWHGKAIAAGQFENRLDWDKRSTPCEAPLRALVDRALAGIGSTLTSVANQEGDCPVLIVSDGTNSFSATMIETNCDTGPLLVFTDALPPVSRRLWIVYASRNFQANDAHPRNVICFTPGTQIATPFGDVPVQHLREGDLVLTRDAGPQPILWIGQRHLSGAKLFRHPELRPIRFYAGALGISRPDEELIVSPSHRLLIANRDVLNNFGTPEVLVSARDLVNGSTIQVEERAKTVSYIHLLLERHHVVWANNVECESYEPSDMHADALSEGDRNRLTAVLPVTQDYGPLARRALTPQEARVLTVCTA